MKGRHMHLRIHDAAFDHLKIILWYNQSLL